MFQRILLLVAILMVLTSQAAMGQQSQEVSDAELVDEIRGLQARISWLKYQQGKHKTYIQRLRQNVADLEYKKAEAGRLDDNLAPYLEETVARLAEAVDEDMPFLPDERSQRLKHLGDWLNDYQLKPSEKLRRILQALQVEAGYGRDLQTTDAVLDLSAIGETEVSLLRIGRVAMYYLSLDGTRVGRWNGDTRQWEPLDKSHIRTIRRVLDMAERKRSVEIVRIPLRSDR